MWLEAMNLPDEHVDHYVVQAVQTPKLGYISASNFRSMPQITSIHEDWSSEMSVDDMNGAGLGDVRVILFVCFDLVVLKQR